MKNLFANRRPPGVPKVGRGRVPRGFALVISLSLMVLLTVLAVGLLGLSTLSLAVSSRETDLAEARSNARLALSMAISQLQKHTGPDQRITATSDQLSTGDGESAAAAGQRHWTGVYRSWESGTNSRPTPDFISWLVSGESSVLESQDSPKSGGSGSMIDLVGQGTIGSNVDGEVRVPAITIDAQSGGKARLAWWVGDSGTKAALAAPQLLQEDNSVSQVRTSLVGAPRNAVELASFGADRPFEELDPKDARLPLVTGWNQSAFLASNKDAIRPLFHDLAPATSGLLTNVRAGGFRKDLSFMLEKRAGTALDPVATALYRVNGETGINLNELWAYYKLNEQLNYTGSATFTTGGTMPSGTPHLVVRDSQSGRLGDDWFHFKQPVGIAYQMIVSLRNVGGILNVVADPIITLWNPLDVPVVIPTSAFMSIEYFGIPYDLLISVNGGPSIVCPLLRTFAGADLHFISMFAGRSQQLVFKPGEVIKISQAGGTVSSNVSQSFGLQLDGKVGFHFASGITVPLRNEAGTNIPINADSQITYSARPNRYTAGTSPGSGFTPPNAINSRHWSLFHHTIHVGFDRGAESMGIGGMFFDWYNGESRRRFGETRNQGNVTPNKPSGKRYYANDTNKSDVFRTIPESEGTTYSGADLASRKGPVLILSTTVKTEAGTNANDRSRSLSRFNPRAHFVDFYDMTRQERDLLPYEFSAEALTTWRNRLLEVSPNGNAYFGGGMDAQWGNSFVVTHSVPREPVYSLAALQHSFANGFEFQRPTGTENNRVNAREPLYPQISHAIGNSVAPAVLSPAQTEGVLAGTSNPRPLADHSYLANLGLWDDWFFSGIAPRTAGAYPAAMQQRIVARNFFNGTLQLPVTRYLPNTGGLTVNEVYGTLFSGANPTDAATDLVASYLRVDGLFNVNSTSVEAWKAVLGGLKGRDVIVRTNEGRESVRPGESDMVPVSGLLSPRDMVAESGTSDPKDEAQWVGRRELTETEIDQLARALVKEVRKRGPFLSLADFVNRRPGSNKDLARAGAVQSALDSNDVEINSAWQEGDRAVPTAVSGRFRFPEAEEGAVGYGMPGIVKQADILTPIAPILSARSDSFIIRAYGESVDKDGKVLARAWCEATVERDKFFVDGADKPETAINSLSSKSNEVFGRRYLMTSFRWLHPDEV